jgi:hypothetical protein
LQKAYSICARIRKQLQLRIAEQPKYLSDDRAKARLGYDSSNQPKEINKLEGTTGTEL